MAATSLLLGANSVAGLGTQTYNVVTAGAYTVACLSTIPRDPGSQLNSAQTSPYASALQIVIKQNSTTLLTIGGSSTNPTQSQPELGSSVRVNCAAGDALQIILSSANAIDNQPNSVKSTMTIYQGY